MQPSAQQISNSLTPTPFSRYIPGDGVIRAANGDSIVIKVGNQVYQLSLQGLGQQYAQTLGGDAGIQAGNSGATAQNYGRQYLQSIGFNLDAAPQLNDGQFADVMAATSNGEGGLSFGKANDLNTISSLLKTPTTTGTSTTLNTQQNTLSAPAGVQPATIGASTGVQAQPNNGGGQSVNTSLQLGQGESIDAYNSRIASLNPNLPAPGTTSSTGVTNTATSGSQTLSSANMTGGSQLPYTQPQTTPVNNSALIPNTPAGTDPYASTAQQSKVQGDINSLTGLNTQLADKSAFSTAQNDVTQQSGFSVNSAFNAKTDLNAKLTALQKQAQGLQLDAQYTIPNQTQLNYEGQGVTKGGMAPVLTGDLRRNSIQQGALAQQALTTQAALAAADGNLVTAQHYADQAIAAKFGPIEAQIKAATDNLNLALNSPDYTNAEKKQAQAQLDFQNQKAAAIAQQKTDAASILNIANNAAANGADAMTLQRIGSATSPLEALKLASQAGVVQQKNVPASAQEYEYAKAHGYTGTYTDYQNEDANRKRSIAAAGIAGGLSPQQVSASFKLADDYDKASGNFGTVVDAYNKINASSGDPSPAGDLSLIFAYMKMLDPTSVVREGEFATAANAGSAFERIGATYNKVLNGQRLTSAQRTDFLNTAKSLYSVAEKQQSQVDSTYSARAQQFGIPSSFVIRDRSSVSSGTTTAQPQVIPADQIPAGYYQASDGKLYKK